MTSVEGQWDRACVREIYGRDENIRTILDHMADRRNPNNNETLVDYLVEELEFERPLAIKTLRALESCKCGEFKIGRRGANSRFEWSASAKAVAKDAKDGSRTTDNDSAGGDKVGMIEHPFLLRPNAPPVTIRVFEDLTRSEAKKVAVFAEILWRNED